MASDDTFNLPLHKRLTEILDQVAELNDQIERNVRLLGGQECASLVREAADLRGAARVTGEGVSTSFEADGSGLNH